MKRVFLLRHCEAHQFQDETSDYEKGLNEVGMKDCHILNKWFDDNHISLDSIIVSRYNKLESEIRLEGDRLFTAFCQKFLGPWITVLINIIDI